MNFLKMIFTKLLNTDNVANVTAQFDSMVQRLRDVEQSQKDRAAIEAAKIEKAQQKRRAAEEEATRAAAVAQRIEALTL